MLTCTACRLEFEMPTEQRDHFRMDWHRYNLKRKVVELPPVTEEQFEFRMRKVREEKEAQVANDPKQKQRTRKEEIKKAGVKTVLKCVACNKTFTTANAHENHLASKKHLANAKKNPEVATAVEKQLEVVSLDVKQGDSSEVKELTDEELAKEIEEYKKQVPLEKEDCIFCAHHAKDFESCLTHMLKEHGFFIPDLEFLVDAEGLVGYLAEKVKVGFYCLYCNGKGKTFRSYQDVQKHMTSLSHCKLRYEDEDLDEMVEFYDYSAQYASKKQNGEEEVEWETDSEASIDEDEDVVEEEVQDEEGDEDNTIGVSETGELVLANGRRLGRREFRRYYKQRFRVDPRGGSTALSTAFVANFLKKRNNIAGGMSIVEAKRKNYWHEKNRSRLDTRSHKLQKNPNRKAMVTV
ncbi:hypothetical protein BBI17_009836 [Phytophthora kernoviae]|uniref:C2H2-type domain-containing protein n=2 Tax=Phytophthora kernoviae TaxID=325452 RepID=A0A421FAR7_9STRA|nr:hypothetical protein G195_011588 [Phytophthora kernoviae 00238/432]RLN32759.1 hypothetical protein BBI17_009836 [Phytophthora kernoviae]